MAEPATRIAYSGEPGAFAEDAVLAAFPRSAPVPVPGFREVFEVVTAGHLAGEAPALAPIVAGVVPIENLVNGTVRETYDLLLAHDLAIVGEVVVPVRLCLAALPGQSIAEIERVYSHIQALGQAEAFLRTRPWTLLTTYNTAGAAKMIVERGERAAAAVVSPRAAAAFGLEVLANDIQQVPDNRTRFLVIARHGARPVSQVPASGVISASGAIGASGAEPEPMRTTMVLAVRNEPGSLYRCLGVFARAGLNLSKLESRPSHDRAWEYVFWVDLDADEAEAARVATELSADAARVRVLGTYARAPEE
ncbi:MAG: prephenate dehydratase [Candidatus Limnocylindrales bacterium]